MTPAEQPPVSSSPPLNTQSNTERNTRELYDKNVTNWVRKHPTTLSDFTARPVLIDTLRPICGKFILDVGCGEGYLMRKLRHEHNAGFIIGVDISPKMIEAAKKEERLTPLGNLSYLVGNIVNLDHVLHPLTQMFDHVVSSFAFNCLTTPELIKSLRHIHRVLKPGGSLVFTVPHPALQFWNRKLYSKVEESQRGYVFRTFGLDYFKSVDTVVEAQLPVRDGDSIPIRDLHKPLFIYMDALRESGFQYMPTVKEVGVTDKQIISDPNFFKVFEGQPLYLLIEVKKTSII